MMINQKKNCTPTHAQKARARSAYAYSFFVWRGSLISSTEQGLSPKLLANQLLFDTLKSSQPHISVNRHAT